MTKCVPPWCIPWWEIKCAISENYILVCLPTLIHTVLSYICCMYNNNLVFVWLLFCLIGFIVRKNSGTCIQTQHIVLLSLPSYVAHTHISVFLQGAYWYSLCYAASWVFTENPDAFLETVFRDGSVCWVSSSMSWVATPAFWMPCWEVVTGETCFHLVKVRSHVQEREMWPGLFWWKATWLKCAKALPQKANLFCQTTHKENNIVCSATLLCCYSSCRKQWRDHMIPVCFLFCEPNDGGHTIRKSSVP